MRRSCALTLCCKAELDWLATEACEPFSGAEQGGLAAHPQLAATQAIRPRPIVDHDLFMLYLPNVLGH